jgi:DNA-binding MarR family transcriptional regulator
MKETEGTTAEVLLRAVALIARRLRQGRFADDLTLAERGTLARLSHGGPATSAELARAEQIRPQSMGATLVALEFRGLIARDRDPQDGRRIVCSFTELGADLLKSNRNARAAVLERALTEDFSDTEIEQLRLAAPLLERLGTQI